MCGSDDVVQVLDLDVGGTFTVGTAANGVSITNGAIDLKNSGSASYMRFYCESSNAHYAEIKSAAHSAYGNVCSRGYLGFAPPLPRRHGRLHTSAVHDHGHRPVHLFKRAQHRHLRPLVGSQKTLGAYGVRISQPGPD